MIKYGIPNEIRDGFRNIIKLSSSELKILFSIVTTAKVGEGVNAIAEANDGKIESLKLDDLKLVFHALFSLVNILVESKDNVEKFTSDFALSYQEVFKDVTDEETKILHNNLSQILPLFTSVKLTVKAKELLTENCNNYSEARIVSDIRIVFEEDEIEKKGQSALVVHNLKIKYSSDRQRKSFFVSLDLSDLKELKKVIERAIDKDRSIKGNNHELNFIDLKN